ncbi:hypothetical protein AvCA_34020 [Azotobacter vinelandii CA]|uniref:Uncharacterized protein n=2 Tax=Azotobacter vinelandii TaxID=354 RepID=C1DPY1_AZOVD|nr:hypothetical protein [Azotobacter vinelandii]ACO79552.1 hypothetical protein Avin_34020 [Azotobacter vinelandii DJ]AGK16322.1 hypothetical protein AvCA_34020 [Azotobacter vinelandii CA]AGK21319.1 hypothetical protein AvCA6_34020 [Azotobacter vinelandii CA6]SFX26018.1 hypothetical protein SAMN04244547_00949 [Azotobacter vinelandii]GLK58051.1 hypothetical protein GCM10017624_02080 [Azotobacter vinelandii]
MDANKYENSIEQFEVELDTEEIRWEDIADEDLEARISKDQASSAGYYC